MEEKFDDLIKKVCAFNDLSSLGGRSLTEIIPILSSLGIRTNPVLTVVLSNHSEYERFTYHDLTDHMVDQREVWKDIGVKFDAFYSGFLGSPRQVNIVREYIEDFRKDSSLILVDPVMGDNGEIYDSISPVLVEKLKDLVKMAHIICPNWTEACFLSDFPYVKDPSEDDLREVLGRLRELTPAHIVITSFPKGEGKDLSTYIYMGDRLNEIKNTYIDVRFPGTGDCFARTLLGLILNGYGLIEGCEIRVGFIEYCISFSKAYDYSRKQGILLEACLSYLYKYRGGGDNIK